MSGTIELGFARRQEGVRSAAELLFGDELSFLERTHPGSRFVPSRSRLTRA
ncbi:MAG: hypothetical protein JNJ54_28265 [Myxococcaceae bacterium]|nr:hypothetical protein [Myxococcaceae bacterium]